MLLIGSQAAKFYFPDFPHNKDWDVIGTIPEITNWVKAHKHEIISYKYNENKTKIFIKTQNRKFEFEIVEPNSSSELFCEINQNVKLEEFYVADPSSLKLIKRSHLTHSIHWEKNIEDYHFLKRKIRKHPTEKELIAFEKRKKEIDLRIGKKKSNLNMTNDDFFKKSSKIGRIYVHDDLHKVTCFYSNPLYEFLKKDKTKAKIDKELFFNLLSLDQIRTVQEECFAIALERIIIPELEKGNFGNLGFCGGNIDKEIAFMYALKRVCTTLTSGWFRDFAIENYPKIKDFQVDYVEKFTSAVQNNIITKRS